MDRRDDLKSWLADAGSLYGADKDEAKFVRCVR